ncbi:MAG: aspartate/glutamate racemase family protein [Spirochaetes bacterium]|nr:aspartate/glutamate racemase family protein [Spirochaetota bacterium]
MGTQKYRIGLIRVVSFTDEGIANLHGRLIEERFSIFSVHSRCIPDQPEGIYDDVSEAAAVPKIVELGTHLVEKEGMDALIVSCAADPGVKELRVRVKVPVFGAGSAAASLALSYGDRVGTVGITEGTPLVMKLILGTHLVGEAKPFGVKTTLDLMKQEGKLRVMEACRALVKDSKCGVIALSCTGMSTIGVAKELEQALGLPVIDPVLAAGFCAWFFLTR